MKLQPLSDERLKQAGWQDIYVSGASKQVHIFQLISVKTAPNVLLIHTPAIAVKSCYECFEQLGRLHSFNVFAIDYAPGEGECSGTPKDFTLDNMLRNIDAVYDYICSTYSSDIHLLGYTGAGAILAQHYLGHNPNFQSFSQFACGIYKDTSPLGIPSFLQTPALLLCRLLRTLSPGLTIPYHPPKAKGYHAELDQAFYDSFPIREPHFFDLKLNSFLQLLECLSGKNSLLNRPISCPTLVFKTMHDRYFSRNYFDQYYKQLSCEKKLVEVNDTHNSYFLTPEPFMKEIALWIHTHEPQKRE